MFGDKEKDVLDNDIEQDIKEKDIQSKEALLTTFERMSIVNLQKQDKKLLLQYCEEKKLISDWSSRQKLKATRQDLAKLIKQPKAKEGSEKVSSEPIQENFIDTYKTAFIRAVQYKDFTQLDNLALSNINSLLLDGISSDHMMNEDTVKKIKFATSTVSSVYLIIRFTGGLNVWKTRCVSMINFLKKRVKKQ